MEHTERKWYGARWLIGGVLITLGIVFMLMNLEVIDRMPLWRFWPLILVVVGLTKLTEPYHRAEAFWLIGLGLWFQWNTVRFMGYGWRDTWPAAMILLGLFWMFESFEKESRRKKVQEQLNANSNS